MTPLRITFLALLMSLNCLTVFAEVPKGCPAKYWHHAEACTDQTNEKNVGPKDEFSLYFRKCMERK